MWRGVKLFWLQIKGAEPFFLTIQKKILLNNRAPEQFNAYIVKFSFNR